MRRFLAIVLVVFLAWTAISALTRVQPGEKAVVRRLGRIMDEQPGPGLFVGLPWGLDQVDRVAVGRVKRVVVGMEDNSDAEQRDTPAGQLLTGDHNLVNVQAEVRYTVAEDQVANYVLQADRADALVARVAETVLAEWIAGRGVDEVLLRGKTLLPFYLLPRMQACLQPYNLGVKIEEAIITRLYPPDEVKEFFDRLAQAQTNIRTQVYQAEQDADRKDREAQAKIFNSQHMTAAYAGEQRLAAQAEAETFRNRLKQYRRLVALDPKYLNTLWQDEMTRLYARMRETGRIDVLDHYLSSEGLNITQFPLGAKKR
jgi:modulator of FtsH protease HflK